MKTISTYGQLQNCSEKNKNWRSPITMRLSLIMIFSFIFLSNITAQTISIDGSPADWVDFTTVPAFATNSYVADVNNTNDNQFTQGSKDGNDISTWAWSNGQTNNKGDISNAGAILQVHILYFCGDRAVNNGDAAIGFWFLKNSVALDTLSGTNVTNYAGAFTGVHQDGDLLIVSHFTQGGGQADIFLYIWSNGKLGSAISGTGQAMVNSQVVNVPAGFHYASAQYPIGDFFEGMVDLSQLSGVSPCFNNFLLETRNSQSISASLQDLAFGSFTQSIPAPIPSNITVCSSTNPVSLTATGCDNGTLKWYDAASGGNLIGTGSPSIPISSTTTFYVSCTTSDGCVSRRAPLLATVNDITPGAIAGNQTLCTPFDPAAFTSTTDASTTAGGVISYQWQSSTTSASAGFSNISGATSATYDAPAVTAKTWYRRIATATLNGVACSANSNVLAVTPNDITPGTIAGDQTLCASSDPAGFTSTTAGSTTGGGVVSYQWQSSTTSASAGFSNISGATSATYAAPAVTAKTWYMRIATATLNGVACSANSNVLAITPSDITPGTIAGDPTLCTPFDPPAFTNTTAGSTTAGGVVSYQWQSSTTSASAGFSNISGATSATYDAPAVTAKTWYMRIATATLNAVACSANSNVLAVTPNDIDPGSIGNPQTVCGSTSPSALTNVSTASSTAGGVITYQWQSNTTGCDGTFTDIASANGATYTPSVLTQTTYYRRMAISTINGVACNANSNCVEITVTNCAHIFPTQTTCCNYLNGPTSTFQLRQVCTSVSAGKISNAVPGVFFYYGDFTAVNGGATTVIVNQSRNTTKLTPFIPQNGNPVQLSVDNCQSVTPTSVTPDNAGNVTITFNAVAGKRYVVSVKYDVKSIVGSRPASGTATYNFTMNISGGTTASNVGTGSLDIVANCSDNTPAPSGSCSTIAQRTISSGSIEPTKDLSVTAYPNPYNNVVNFQIRSAITGKATLEVFDIVGRRLAVIYHGAINANVPIKVKYNVPSLSRVALFYRLSVGDKIINGGVLPDKQ